MLVVAEKVPPTAPAEPAISRRSVAEVLAPFIKTAKGHATACYVAANQAKDDPYARARYDLRQEVWEAVIHMLKEQRS